MTTRSKITCSSLFLFGIKMSFEMHPFLLRRGTSLLLFSLFYCLFGVGFAQSRSFRRFNLKLESSSRPVSDERWFTQKLDHFNGADSREWKQVSLMMCNMCPHYLLTKIMWSYLSCLNPRFLKAITHLNIDPFQYLRVCVMSWLVFCAWCFKHDGGCIFCLSSFSFRGTLWMKPSTSQVVQCFWW